MLIHSLSHSLFLSGAEVPDFLLVVGRDSFLLSKVILRPQPCGPPQHSGLLLQSQQESLSSGLKDLRSYNIITGMMQPSPLAFNATQPRE